jgi:tryptophan-rich sensory protein
MHIINNPELKRESFWITISVFIWGSVCAHIVRSYAGYFQQNFVSPMEMPSTLTFDLIWLFVYVFLLLGIQLVWHQDIEKRTRRIFLVLVAISAILNILMYVLFYILNEFTINFYENLLHTASVVALIIFSWTISKPAAFFFIPYFIASAVSLYTVYLVMLAN